MGLRIIKENSGASGEDLPLHVRQRLEEIERRRFSERLFIAGDVESRIPDATEDPVYMKRNPTSPTSISTLRAIRAAEMHRSY